MSDRASNPTALTRTEARGKDEKPNPSSDSSGELMGMKGCKLLQRDKIQNGVSGGSRQGAKSGGSICCVDTSWGKSKSRVEIAGYGIGTGSLE